MKKFRLWKDGVYWRVDYQKNGWNDWYIEKLFFYKWTAKRYIKNELEKINSTPEYEYYP